jgi:protein disulfide-isomerase
MTRFLTVVAGLLLSMSAAMAQSPYDEAADAKREVRQALAEAAASKTAVLIVFGANWCADCKLLDAAMKSATTSALLARDYRIVKVNVGRFDRNVDLARAYGVPLTSGIPAVAIVSPANQVLYATRAGELANARQMGETGVHEFLKQAVAQAKPKS